jgi:hypothetical protein
MSGAHAAEANGHESEDPNIEAETYHDQATVKAQAITMLMREHKAEVEGLLVEQEEEWFNDDPFLLISMENTAKEQKVEKIYGAQTEFHEFGVHIDTWWIGTSRAMLCLVYLVLFALIAIVIWQFMFYSYQVFFSCEGFRSSSREIDPVNHRNTLSLGLSARFSSVWLYHYRSKTFMFVFPSLHHHRAVSSFVRRSTLICIPRASVTHPPLVARS